MSAIALFSHIEQQLNALRAKALKDLEEKAREREDQLRVLSSSYLRLKSDFEYNVQLLDARDAELAQRDAELAQSAGEHEKHARACKRLQGELTRAHEEAEMQQALLQQAEAVWQAQHDRLASELAEARRAGKDALAAALAQRAIAVKAMQAAQREAAELQAGLAAAGKEAQEVGRQRDRLSRDLQECQRRVSDLRQQHAEASAELTERTSALHKQSKELQQEIAAERAQRAVADERLAALAASEQRLQQQLEQGQAEHQAEGREATEQLDALQGKHASDLAAADARRSSERTQHAQQAEQQAARHASQVQELQRRLEEAVRSGQAEAEARKAAAHQSAQRAADMAAELDRAQHAAADQSRLIKELQELNGKLLGQKTEAEGRTQDREADIAQLQLEVASLQQQQQHSQPGDCGMLSVQSTADPAAQRYTDHSIEMDIKALLNDKCKLQERLEDEEMEKMRLAAALATLRADMESLSAAQPAPDMRLTQQVSELECQLAAAQRDVQRLAADNDALMEVSNALAAQQRRARQKLEAEAQEDARRPPQRTPIGRQHRHPPPWWPPQAQYVIMPPLVPPAPVPLAPALPVPVPVQHTAAQQAPVAWVPQSQPGAGAAGQQAQHAQQEVPAHAVPAPGVSADVAARLQHIEALAEEIARAQVAGGHPQEREAESSMRPGSTLEASHEADEPRRRGSVARASDSKTAARKGSFQREKLRALQQRPPMPKVPHVRNWNIVDDDAV